MDLFKSSSPPASRDDDRCRFLARGVAHDLNNLLGPLVLLPNILLRHLAEDGPLSRDVKALRRGAEKIARLAEELRLVHDDEELELHPLSLAAEAGAFLRGEEWKALLEENPDASLELDAPEGLPPVRGSAVHLHRMFWGLARFSVGAAAGESRLSLRAFAEGAGRVTMEVVHHGFAVDDALFPRLFEPYFLKFTLGRTGGSGLDLALARRIAEKHGATVEAARALAGGLLLRVRFPAAG